MMKGTHLWDAVWQDLRYAARGLRLKPGFTAAVVATLALGIGANATMFGIIDRVLFRPPAYLATPDRVHRLYLGRTFEREGESFTSNISYKRYTELAGWSKTIDAAGAFFYPELAVGTGEDAREMRIAAISASMWGLFDLRPEIGRFFVADEDRVPTGTPVVVLSYGYWQSRYGGRRDALGQPMHIGSRAYTIVGVAPKGFVGPDHRGSPVAFIPITASAADMFGGDGVRGEQTYYGSHNMSWMEMVVRRTPTATLEQATAEMTSLYRRSYLEQRAANTGMRPIELARPRVVVAPVLRERGPVQGQVTKVATWLVGVAAIVLLIACANVGNLLLARAIGRRREIAVRVALGVSRGRLLGQLLLESLLLAALGAAAGLVVAQWGGGILRRALLTNVDATSAFADRRVLLFTLGAALLAGLLTGLAPVLHAVREDLVASLKSGMREGTYHRSRTRAVLLVAQGALSVVLLVGAGLFVRSLQNVRDLDLGYDSERVLFVSPQMRGVQLDSVARRDLRNRLLARAQSLPSVERAARTVSVPFWMSMNFDIRVPGIDSVSRLGDFYYHAVTPDYFATMGTRLLRGRGITEADTRDAERVMVVSQSMARVLWPGKDALGQCVKMGGADSIPCSRVVGVVQDIKRGSLTKETGLQYYVPIEQMSRAQGGLFVRTRGDAVDRVEEVRRALQGVMPGVSYLTVTPLDQILGNMRRSWTLGATMFTVFGALALLLAAVGLYSVIAYNVAQRTHELGVRVALGAQSGDVVRLVLGEGLRLAAIGIAIGAVIALAAGRFVAPLLFDVSPKDPATFAGVTLTLLAIALAASFVPAWRASRVDPLEALRAQ